MALKSFDQYTKLSKRLFWACETQLFIRPQNIAFKLKNTYLMIKTSAKNCQECVALRTQKLN